MAYKDKEKQKVYQAAHFQKNKVSTTTKQRERRRYIARWLYDLKTKMSCSKCGENHPACIEFHHRDPEDKTAEVSSLVSHGSKEVILKEIAKCDVLCSNCHRKLHFELDTHNRKVRTLDATYQQAA